MQGNVVQQSQAIRRLTTLRESREFFQHNIDKLRETGHRFIVLHGRDIVATEDTSDKAWKTVASKSVPAVECLLVTVPQPGESYFY